MKRPQSKILDIGIGQGFLSLVLSENGHQVVGIDQYDDSIWANLKKEREKNGIQCINGDARNLDMFDNGEFDIALLVSVIEHVPTNTIFCEKRKLIKTGKMLQEEYPEKLKVLSEAVRVVRTGGIVIITSDNYLDYPPDMNISWRKLLGLEGIDSENLVDLTELFIEDEPCHKGRHVSVGIVVEKIAENAHEVILKRAC